MKVDIFYRGILQRKTRTFLQDNVATDPDALTVTIKKESDGSILVANSITYSELDIIAQKISTGKFYCKVTPDSDEPVGLYVLYWRYTYGSGDSAETNVVIDYFEIRAEDEVPVIVDNYVSLDALERRYPGIIKLGGGVGQILRRGEVASRILDSELDDRFDIPIRIRPDTKAYDQPLVSAAVAMAIADILHGLSYDERAEDFETEYERYKDGINNGRYRLYEEITKSELGFAIPKQDATNTGVNVELELDPNCQYTGDLHRIFIIQIDAAGDVGTATFKISNDAGNSWSLETQETRESGYSYPAGMYGLGFRFFRLGTSANLADGDKWTIGAYPTSLQITPTKKSIRYGRVYK